MDDKVKWILFAIAGYFAYDWYTQRATAAASTPGGAPPEEGQHPIGTAPEAPPLAPEPPVPVTTLPPWTAPVYTPPAQTPAMASALATTSGDQLAIHAATFNQDAIAESVRRGQRYSLHQWNWFREQTQGEQPDPATYYSGDPNTLVTAAEYMLIRQVALATGVVQAAGGVGDLGWAPILPWSTAWSA
jgi:hypothetical protein